MKNRVFEPLYGASKEVSPQEDAWETPIIQESPKPPDPPLTIPNPPVALPAPTGLGVWGLDNQKILIIALVVVMVVALGVVYWTKIRKKSKKKVKRNA